MGGVHRVHVDDDQIRRVEPLQGDDVEVLALAGNRGDDDRLGEDPQQSPYQGVARLMARDAPSRGDIDVVVFDGDPHDLTSMDSQSSARISSISSMSSSLVRAGIRMP